MRSQSDEQSISGNTVKDQNQSHQFNPCAIKRE